MTLQQFINQVGNHPWLVLAAFAAPPLLVAIMGRLHGPGRGEQSPWKYLYSLAVYVAAIPGTFAAVLTAYTLFLLQTSLLEVNLLIYGLPIVSMVATLILARKNVALDAVPGFDRLSALIILLVITFAVVLFIAKTRVWIFFGSSLLVLGLIALVVFGVLYWASHQLAGGSKSPGSRRPPGAK